MAEDDSEDMGEDASKEEDVYSDPEELLEDEDELDDVDEGFMKGYNESEVVVKCGQCKKIIEGEKIEEQFDDETFSFCSEQCAANYAEKKLSQSE